MFTHLYLLYLYQTVRTTVLRSLSRSIFHLHGSDIKMSQIRDISTAKAGISALAVIYGLCPIPPSSVRVSPVIYLKSGDASCTQTRPISSSASP